MSEPAEKEEKGEPTDSDDLEVSEPAESEERKISVPTESEERKVSVPADSEERKVDVRTPAEVVGGVSGSGGAGVWVGVKLCFSMSFTL